MTNAHRDPLRDRVVGALINRGAEPDADDGALTDDVLGRAMLFWHDRAVFVGHPGAELGVNRRSTPVVISVVVHDELPDRRALVALVEDGVRTAGPLWSVEITEADGCLHVWLDRALAESETAEPGLGHALDEIDAVVHLLRNDLDHATPTRPSLTARRPTSWVSARDLDAALNDRWRCTNCRWEGTGREADSEIDLSNAYRVACPRCDLTLFRSV